MTRIYHFIGRIEGQTPPGEGVQIGGMSNLPATVRTWLYACSECGAAVPDGNGKAQHERWHGALTEMLSRSGPFIRNGF